MEVSCHCVGLSTSVLTQSASRRSLQVTRKSHVNTTHYVERQVEESLKAAAHLAAAQASTQLAKSISDIPPVPASYISSSIHAQFAKPEQA